MRDVDWSNFAKNTIFDKIGNSAIARFFHTKKILYTIYKEQDWRATIYLPVEGLATVDSQSWAPLGG